MLEQAIRLHYQHWFVNPVARKLHPHLSPLNVTLLALVSGTLVIPALLFNHPLVAVILLSISGYLDTLDGTLARYANNTTAFGSVCDIVTDRAVEFSAILGLWFIEPHTRGLLCMLMLGSILLCITSFLVVGIFTPNNSDKSFHYSAGLIERAEAFIFFSLMILLPDQFIYLSGLFILLVIFTTVKRLYEFKQQQSI